MIMMTMMTSAQLTLRALMYETKNIIKTAGGADADGCVIDTESLGSMNFWCYLQKFMDVLKNEFPVF